MTMKGKKKFVAKVKASGRVVVIYPSIRECAKNEFCSPDAMRERIKYGRCIDGYYYRYCEVEIL